MKYKEFCKYLGCLERKASTQSDSEFVALVWEMMLMLDETDMEDFFGTEGWKHHIGLE